MIALDDLFDIAVCRVCGCTDDDCTECVEATGEPCTWAAVDLCSRCADEAPCTNPGCDCHDLEPRGRPVVTLITTGDRL